MLRRLRIYFVGFGIGMLMVYVLFLRQEERDLDFWTPGQRILEAVRSDADFQKSPRLTCFSECLSLDSAAMSTLWTESSVKVLNPGEKPHRYQIQLKTDEQHIEALVELSKKTHRLISLKSFTNPISCDCAS